MYHNGILINFSVVFIVGIGDAILQVNIDQQIVVDQNVSGKCLASWTQYPKRPPFMHVGLVGHTKNKGCSVYYNKPFEVLEAESLYRVNFTVFCTKEAKIQLKCNTYKEVDKKWIEASPESPRIISNSGNIQVGRGMPASLQCTVHGNQSDYKLAWKNAKNRFVSVGEECTEWSTQVDTKANAHHYHLTMHSVEESVDYTCVVIDPDGKVIDSQVQHIEVVSKTSAEQWADLIKFLFWNWKH